MYLMFLKNGILVVNIIPHECLHNLYASHFTTWNCFALHNLTVGEHVCVPKKTNTEYGTCYADFQNVQVQSIHHVYECLHNLYASHITT